MPSNHHIRKNKNYFTQRNAPNIIESKNTRHMSWPVIPIVEASTIIINVITGLFIKANEWDGKEEEDDEEEG